MAACLVACAGNTGTSSRGDSPSEPTLEALEGAWLGAVELPDGRSLRMGIEILRRADDSMGANFASLDEGARYLPVRDVSLEGRLLSVRVDSPALTIAGEVAGDLESIDARIGQGGATDPLRLERVDELPTLRPPRIQTPRAPFPYVNEEVRIHNTADDVWLAATLSRPRGREAVPGIVFVGGSGPHYRDYEDHQLPLVLADHLVRSGYAVLRYDKRGVYGSTGQYTSAGEADLARDAAAALQYLQSRTDFIMADRVGFIGHSEGSQLAAHATAQLGADAAFLISLAGAGLSPLEATLLQDDTESVAAGASPEEVAVLVEFSRRFYAAVVEAPDEAARRERLLALYDALSGAERDTVIAWNGEYGRATYSLNVDVAARDSFASDMRLPAPASYWADIRSPALLVYGGRDSQVPAREHLAAIQAARPGAPLDSVIFPDKNHLFQTAETGAVEEYAQIEETIAPEVLDYIADWLSQIEWPARASLAATNRADRGGLAIP